jgi:hypothetical protein
MLAASSPDVTANNLVIQADISCGSGFEASAGLSEAIASVITLHSSLIAAKLRATNFVTKANRAGPRDTAAARE